MTHTPSIGLSHLDVKRGSVEHLTYLLKVSERLEGSLQNIHREYAHQLPQMFKLSEKSQFSLVAERQAQSRMESPPITQEIVDKSSVASIWNREGFTPLPQGFERDDLHSPKPSQVFESVDHSSEEPLYLAHQQRDEGLVEAEKKGVVDGLLIAEAKEEEEVFIPIADRLMMNAKLDRSELHDEPDSSVPQPLEALYDDFSPSPQGLFVHTKTSVPTDSDMGEEVIPIRLSPPPFDPELHAVLAPAPLENKRRSPLPMMFVVALICLLVGGLIAFTLLHDLATYVK